MKEAGSKTNGVGGKVRRKIGCICAGLVSLRPKPSLTRGLVSGLMSILLLTLSFVPSVQAASGDLDTSFSGDGKVTRDIGSSFGSSNDEVNAVAIQTNGQIVVAGHFNGDFALVRYNSDGSQDNNFDSDPFHMPVGVVITDFGVSGSSVANAIAIQNDNKIVAAGFSGDNFALARYCPNGKLDNGFNCGGNGFGVGGKVTTDLGGSIEEAEAIAIQDNGQIVVAGYSNAFGDNDFALVRYNSDGSVDTNFCCGDGATSDRVLTDFNFVGGGPGGSRDQAYAIAIQTDGRIVVAGESDVNDGRSDFALVRYNSNGTLDNTFDLDGTVTTNIFNGTGGTSLDSGKDIAIRSNKIVVAGIASGHFALARYNSNGSPDTTFDDPIFITSPGTVIADFGGSSDGGEALAIQADGKIVVAGFSQANDTFMNFALARFNSSGSLDFNFSGDGKLTTDFSGSFDEAHDLAIQTDGKIVVAGIATVSGSEDIALARYLGSGPAATCDGLTATIVGTAGNDIINGTAGPDIIQGLEGNDTIYGNSGNDTICGGDGNDTIAGGDGNDKLRGGNHDDALNGKIGTDSCNGGPHVVRDTATNCESVINVP